MTERTDEEKRADGMEWLRRERLLEDSFYQRLIEEAEVIARNADSEIAARVVGLPPAASE